MRFIVSISGITTAAGTGGEWAVPMPCAGRIVGAYITDTDGIAADNTDYVTATIYGTNGYDSRAANQGALTADTPLALGLKASEAVLAAGSQLKVNLAKAGSGKATEAGVAWLIEAAN
jgi:hypothetical protein